MSRGRMLRNWSLTRTGKEKSKTLHSVASLGALKTHAKMNESVWTRNIAIQSRRKLVRLQIRAAVRLHLVLAILAMASAR